MATVKYNTPEALVGNVVHLISLPDVYTRLEQVFKDPNHTRNDIADIVSVDPALSARILRIINSSYYGFPNLVQNIATAVNLLGEYDLRNMVLVTSVANSVALLADGGIDIRVFWQHSLRCGISAKLLALLKKHKDPELLFLGGLLHDLGQLIIYKNERELYDTVSWHVTHEARERYVIEDNLLGFNHAHISSLLVESWNLPGKLAEIIKYHHQPELATLQPIESKLLALADQLAHYLNSNTSYDSTAQQKCDDNFMFDNNTDLDEWPKIKAYLEELEIKPEALTDLLNNTVEQSQEIEDIIYNV